MEIKVVKARRDFIELEVSGIDFSVLDSLKSVLNDDERIEYAGATLLHPLTRNMRLVVKTKGNEDVIVAINDCLSKLMGMVGNLDQLVRKALGEVPERGKS